MCEQHRLVGVERPAVIAGKPAHVRRIGDDDQVEPLVGHGAARAADALLVFLRREIASRLGHAHSLDVGKDPSKANRLQRVQLVKKILRAATCRYC
jgi:hypothetical protein